MFCKSVYLNDNIFKYPVQSVIVTGCRSLECHQEILLNKTLSQCLTFHLCSSQQYPLFLLVQTTSKK